MALFLVANNLTPADTLDPERELAFPESVVELFEGRLGQPPGGFPPALQERVLKGRPPMHRPARRRACRRPTSRPPARRPPALLGRPATDRDALSFLLYPRVFPDLAAHERTYSDTSMLPTRIFFFGPDPAAENLVEIEPGKTLIVKLLAVGEPHADGKRTVFFELNGQPREVEVVDRSLASSVVETPKADPNDPNQIAAPLPGLVVGVAVVVGDAVRKGQKLLSIEAMKMETTLYAERPGRVAEVLTAVGQQVKTGELLLKLKESEQTGSSEADDLDRPGTGSTRPASPSPIAEFMGWPFVRTMIARDVVESTSDLARELVAEDRDDLPLAVWADAADAGAGAGREHLVVGRGEPDVHDRHRPRLAWDRDRAGAAARPGHGGRRDRCDRSDGAGRVARDSLAQRRRGGRAQARGHPPRAGRDPARASAPDRDRPECRHPDGRAPAEVGRMAVALTQLRDGPSRPATTSRASCARSSIGSVRSCHGWRATIRNCRSAGIASTPCAIGGCGSTSGPGSWPGRGAGSTPRGRSAWPSIGRRSGSSAAGSFANRASKSGRA